tara:strand:+ start:35461 stop:35817 length:357 start_codon:yes stop_codon:yes gene_type:complete
MLEWLILLKESTKMENVSFLSKLTKTIKTKKGLKPAESYTATLLSDLELLTKKIGEEAMEVVVSSLAQDKENVKREAADLIYHLMVLLEKNDLTIVDVINELESRHGISGHEEKKSRK